jgi:PAS domain S-box-containing protein
MEQPADKHFLHSLDEESALLTLMEGTATETGAAFFDALVVNLSQALKTQGALITERVAHSRRLKTLAAWFEGEISHGHEYDFTGTPCESVIKGARYLHVPSGLRELYPESKEARKGITSYLGAPLKASDGLIMGNLAVFDSRPMPEKAKELAIFRIFAARAAAELQRIRAEERLRLSERKYRGIIEATTEGYVSTNTHLDILDVNNAFCQMIGLERQELLGRSLGQFCAYELRRFLDANCPKLISGGGFDVKGALATKEGHGLPVILHGCALTDGERSDQMLGLFVTDLSTAEKSLALASEVQQAMLPSAAPKVEGLDIAGRSQPCENVGGDYFDFVHLQNDASSTVTVAVGDVSGHGVDAALLMTSARAYLRMRAPLSKTMAGLVNGLNRHLISEAPRTHHFMTLFLLKIDAVKRSLEWVRAGHEPALLYDPDTGEFKALKGAGLALGLELSHRYGVNHQKGAMAERQIIVMGTDGIWEARDINGELFGKRRLGDVISSRADHSAQQIVDAVFDTVNSFTLGTIADDDKTMVVIKLARWSPYI